MPLQQRKISRQILDIRRDKQEFQLPRRSVILGVRMGEDAGGFTYPEVLYAHDVNEKGREARSFLIIKDSDTFDNYIMYLGSLNYTNDSNVSFLLHILEVY